MKGWVKLAVVLVLSVASLVAESKVKVVTSFSILQDMVQQIGGEAVEVVSLVPIGADVHEFDPSPQSVATLANANLLVINGLGFDDWTQRLVKSAGYKGLTVVATKGVVLIEVDEAHHHHDGPHHDHEHHGKWDPHAWQDLSNAVIYVQNIVEALRKIDPEHASDYEQRGDAYVASIKLLDAETKAKFASLPPARKQMVTNHDAFSYFAKAYGIKVHAAMGISSASRPSAKIIASLIDEIKEEKVPAVFFENIFNARLIEQLARDSGAKVGGKLYTDSISESGPTSTYLGMFQYNVDTIFNAIR
ncbi:metal ABC transporter substrate-binding protein [Basilea psittacipulmonis]|uniref:Metal ABC transporter substrate-binding protein n=1 Tax=Basilea psittacipulmonis DSM 24701 TaxID=1072685 RepID=A0A077DEZ1_9BURK|nr:metal ABC transporter substrate-binding protein [Basilea psittacipulmonis]AIL31997.1 hypothetical protein IX83_00460 [Basilea psittacipulmonis DSM 24701]